MSLDDSNTFPPELKVFEKEEYTVTLEIKEENVKDGLTVFTAKDICLNAVACDNKSFLSKSGSASQDHSSDTVSYILQIFHIFGNFNCLFAIFHVDIFMKIYLGYERIGRWFY